MKMNDITIKQARDCDSDTICSILQEAANWLVDQGTPMWKTDELAADTIRAEAAAGLFWLAFVNGESAGCVRFQTEDILFWPDAPPEESAFIHRLAVRRKFAGGKVSSALIDWAKSRATALGKRFLRLDCEAKTWKLCQIYERAGFTKHSERQVGPYWVARYECELSKANKNILRTSIDDAADA